MLSQLEAELVRVTNERDMLATQVRDDAQLIEDKVHAAEQQCNVILFNLAASYIMAAMYL